MTHDPPTQGNAPRRPSAFKHLTALFAWAVLVAAAPLLLLESARQMPEAVAQERNASRGHEFRFDAKQMTEKPATVHVAGEFNGWNAQGLAMTDDGTGMWTARLDLDEGAHRYKFVLDAGTPKQQWLEDPNADIELREPDGHGGYNSVVVVGPGAKKFDPPKPDHINSDAIPVLDISNPTDVNVIDANTVRLRVRTQLDDVETAEVWTGSGRRMPLLKLHPERGLQVWGNVLPLKTGEKFKVVLRDGNAAVELHHAAKTAVSVGAGTSLDELLAASSFDTAVPEPGGLRTPLWARDAVWYQIFPERFRNGDPMNDPGDVGYDRLVPWNGDWWTDLPGETPPAGPTLEQDNFYRGTGDVWNRRYGGDLAGVREKLPHLRSVGFNAIYFNPVFEAESMHKYDTADFRHIDDNFGVVDHPREIPFGRTIDRPLPAVRNLGNRALFNLDGTPVPSGHVETDDPATWRWTKSDLLFLDFLKEARRQGFHVIVDGVFNHVGRAHPFWKDVLDKGKNSPYADWFEVTDWGDEKNWRPMENPYEVHGKPGGIRWRAWDGPDGHLPAFKKDPATGLARGPYEHIMAVTRRWLDPDGNPATRDGIDGWRLDVPGDIPSPFWIAWRKVVKESNPEAYITGEIWTWATPWINKGDQFDAVMNYQFAMACQDFFADQRDAITPTQLNDRLIRLQYTYPFQAALVMQNLFDSHDTDRAPSWFVNPDRPYDGANRPQDNARDQPYDPRAPDAAEWARYLQMVAFQMTFLGAPMAYYGAELGMFSPDDPSNRQPVPWDDKGPYTQDGVKIRPEVLETYRRFVAIRNTLPALRQGFYSPLVIDDERGVLAFARDLSGQRVMVVINRSDTPATVELPAAEGSALFDYASVDVAEVRFTDNAPDARPTLVRRDGATALPVAGGKVTVTLKPWGTAVIAE